MPFKKFLNTDIPLVERRSRLLDYGFVCACTLCTRQLKQQQRKNNQKKSPNQDQKESQNEDQNKSLNQNQNQNQDCDHNAAGVASASASLNPDPDPNPNPEGVVTEPVSESESGAVSGSDLGSKIET